jgi:hypothetical protein
MAAPELRTASQFYVLSSEAMIDYCYIVSYLRINSFLMSLQVVRIDIMTDRIIHAN